MTWLSNHYVCPRCKYAWDDEWSCAVDDDCPSCGFRHIGPEDSEDLTIATEIDNSGSAPRFLLKRSSDSAGDAPEYEIIGNFGSMDELERHKAKLEGNT